MKINSKWGFKSMPITMFLILVIVSTIGLTSIVGGQIMKNALAQTQQTTNTNTDINIHLKFACIYLIIYGACW